MFDENVNIPDYNYDTTVTGNNNVFDNDMNIDVNMVGYGNQYNDNNQNDNYGGYVPNNVNMGGCQPRERYVHRTFVHEVPHVCPIHTRIINHHIYKHTYRPEYTCSEENTVSNIQCGSCNQFR